MKYVQVCKALYDYEARTEDELSIKENDILYVIEKEDEDWWRAELKQQNGEDQGPVGLVPADYLEEVTPIGRVRAEFDYVAQQEEELSFEEGDEMDLLEQDDPDWFLVKLNNGQIGLAPSNYVQDIQDHFEEAQEQPQQPQQPQQQDPIPTPPPVVTQTSMPPPQVQPILSHTTGSTTATREVIADDAQSWNVHEYDAAKKKKKKGKGSLFVGNGMICYGSETDKSLPVQQYPILDVTKYLYDGKNLHIEVDGAKQAVLDLQASSKSEAKAILVKISDSTRAAQMSNTHLNLQNQKQIAAPAAAIPPVTSSYAPSPPPQAQPQQYEDEEEESNCVPKWGISIYSFNAEGGDELSVEENEQIYVLDYERTDGWWRVQKVDGDVGLVPSSYVQFDDDEDHDHSTAAAAAAAAATGVGAAAAAAAVANSRSDNVEEIRKKRAEEERALQQQRIIEEKAREDQRRRDQEEQDRKRREQEESRRKEEENRRREEERNREEQERERRRQVQEAAKRAEAARQKQLEEDYKRKETERKASLARSASKSRHQDLPKPDTSKIRTWTDRSGSFKVEAQFIDFHNGKLRLHKLNGVKIDVPVEKMCSEDVRWVEAHTRSNSQDDEITPSMPPRPQQSAPPPATIPSKPPQKKLNERWDWFDWFMLIGIPMQSSLQYAGSFKAEKLDDSDIPNLTHKQMKTLGLKEEHVQRIQRYIETGRPEDSTEEEAAEKKKGMSQIEKDEELARKLQKEWEGSEGAKSKAPSSNARPRPSVSAPKDVHPDLLDFIGSQLSNSSADTNKGKAPEKPKGDLIGFNDDAWAPRAETSPVAVLSPMKTAQTFNSTPAVSTPPPAPAGPTPEQIKAAEAERKRIQEEEQIQKIQLMSLQRQAKEQQQQLEQLQKLTQQQLELQKQLAMQTGTQQQQQQQQQQMLQVQAQQQHLQQQLAQQPAQLQPSFAPQTTGFNASQTTGFSASQPTGFNASQPTGFNAQQPTGFNSQTTGFQNGFTGQQSTLAAGRQRPTPANSLPLDPSLSQWQPNQQQQQQQQHHHQQPQQTGFQTGAMSIGNQQPMQTGFQPQQPQLQQQNSWQALQPQMTGFPANSQPVGGNNYQQQQLPQPLAPSSAAGQQGLQRSQTIGVQPTGRHWNSATADNPFGSPTLSPLQAQMTGVQFSTPSPQAFHQSPLQSQQQTGYMQPQMTGFPPQQQQQQQQQPGNSIFTPQGSMQYGQTAFPNSQRPW